MTEMVNDIQGEPLRATTITPKVYKYLKRATEDFDIHERKVVLTFNAFPFRSVVNANPKRRHYGGELLPSHCVIPCIRFIQDKRFHVLGSLFFYKEYWERDRAKFSKDMSECIKLYILALANIKLTVVATVTPCIDIFIQAIQILAQIPYMAQYNADIRYDVGPYQNIFHLHDPMYIQSELVNLLLLNDFHYKLYNVDYRASVGDILECLRLDNKPLLSKDVEGVGLLDQGEAIGEYYLSAELSESLRRHIQTGALPPIALGTRLLIVNLRIMFHEFYSDPIKYSRLTTADLKGLIHFMNTIEMVKNEEALVEHSKVAGRVDPRKSRNVRNLKDIDSYINEQTSEKSSSSEQAKLEETAKKLEYDIYSEMCNTPDFIQKNPNVVISTASGKILSAVDSPGKKQKKKKKNAPIPPEVRKELIKARIAAAETSTVPTPSKEKGSISNNVVSSPAKQKNNQSVSSGKEATSKQKGGNSNDLPTIEEKDLKSLNVSSKSKRKQHNKNDAKSDSTRQKSIGTTDTSSSTDQIYREEVAKLNKYNKDMDKVEVHSKDSKLKIENSNTEVPPKNEETEHIGKITEELKSRSPVDLEISEALMMLSGQPQESKSKIQKIDRAITARQGNNFDDLPDLVDDSDHEMDMIPKVVEEYEASLQLKDVPLVRNEAMEDSVEEINATKNNNFDDDKNEIDASEHSETAISKKRTATSGGFKDPILEAIEDTDLSPSRMVDLTANSRSEIKYELPDLIDDSISNILEDDGMNEEKRHVGIAKSDDAAEVSEINNTNTTKSGAEGISIESIEIPDLIDNSRPINSNVRRSPKDAVQIATSIFKNNANKLSAAEISTGGDELESSPEFELPYSNEGDHTYSKRYDPAPNPEMTKETLYEEKEEEETIEKNEHKEQIKSKDENERKHLSPIQTSDIISPPSESKKNCQTHLDKVRKLKFDDGPNKENLDQSLPPIITASDVEQAPSELKKIVKTDSIADLMEKERNLRIALGVEKGPKPVIVDDYQPSDLISTKTMNSLVDEHLTPDEIKDLLGPEAEVDTSSKVESVVQRLRKTLPSSGKLSSSDQKTEDGKNKNVEPKPERNLLKISWKDETVSIQKVDADSVKPPPKDPFKKTDLRDVDSSIMEISSKKDLRRSINKEEGNLSDHSVDTIGSIPEFPDEFDDGGPSWGAVDEQVRALVQSMDKDEKSESKKSNEQETHPPQIDTQNKTSELKTDNEVETQEEMRKTGAIKKTYQRRTRESRKVTGDYKSRTFFKLFVNKLSQFVREVARKYYMPYNPEEYLEKVVEECEKFFQERETVGPEEFWRTGRSAYQVLFRSLIGEVVCTAPGLEEATTDLIKELELFTLHGITSGPEVATMTDEQLLVKTSWVQNIFSMRALFEYLRTFEVFDELAPDLFGTDHVRSLMKHVFKYSNDFSLFQTEPDCTALNIRECFENLKSYGSVLLVE